MTKVWFVIEGDHDGDTTQGVFSSEDLANEYASLNDRWEVISYDVDPPYERNPGGMGWYQVNIHCDGVVSNVFHDRTWVTPLEPVKSYGGKSTESCFGCWARDKDHAIEVGKAKWEQLKAEGRLVGGKVVK